MATSTACFLLLASSALAWQPMSVQPRKAVSVAALDRRHFLETPAAFAAVALTSSALVGAPAPSYAEGGVTPSGVKYEIMTPAKPGALKPALGDLCAVRFQGSYKGVAFDDILSAPEPFYFRIGSDRLLKGINEAILLMPVGSIWKLTIPGELAFGVAGRGASPGKARIPPNAEVEYILEVAGLPGKEEDLIEVIGDV